MKALILALASARLTQLVVDDAITEPIREAISDRAVPPRDGRLVVETMEHQGDEPEGNAVWGFVDEIVSCHACTSVWAGTGILVAEQTGVGRFLVRVLALSQAALAVKAVIERIDRG